MLFQMLKIIFFLWARVLNNSSLLLAAHVGGNSAKQAVPSTEGAPCAQRTHTPPDFSSISTQMPGLCSCTGGRAVPVPYL